MHDFSKKYNREDFLEFLKDFLPNDLLLKEEEYKDESKVDLFGKIYKLGEVESLEKISILEIEHNFIYDPRIALTKKVYSLFNKLSINKALVIFYCLNSQNYRFSLVESSYIWKSDIAATKEFSLPKRLSFFLGPKAKLHTPHNQLKNKVKNYKDLKNRFNIEIVNEEFFVQYRKLYFNLMENLNADKKFTDFVTKKKIKIDVFSKKLLGQIVFCYFLQKKGYLGASVDANLQDGNKNFIREKFYDFNKNKKNFYNEFLEYFFYEGLNAPNDNDYVKSLKCKIPYLNGGLFEVIDEYDWKKEFLNIKNEIFSNASKNGILDIFDLYNFTVDEHDDVDVEIGIDPEMLGKVFENLLEENLRKGTGSYYTPRNIVNFMSLIAISRYLKKKIFNNIEIEQIFDFVKSIQLSKNDLEINNKNINNYINKILENKAKELDDILFKIKIFDPAIGSGAFALSTMNIIVNVRFFISKKYLQKKNSLYSLKKQFIQNSIFGVDLDPSATDITKLRLWLSLIVESEGINNLDTLPNLGYKIIQGNSLISEYLNYDFDNLNLNKHIQQKFDFDEDKKDEQLNLDIDYENLSNNFLKLSNLQNDYFLAKYKSKKSRLKSEIDIQLKILLKEFLNTTNSSDENILNLLDNKKIKNFFSWKLFFPSVFLNNNGFDILIGNPPYGEIIKENKEYFKKKYVSAEGKYDSYKFFIEKSLNLLSKDGILSFVTPDTWTTLNYYKKLRNLIKSKYQILDISKTLYDVFKAAKVDTIIFLISKKNNQDHSTRILDHNFNVIKKMDNIFVSDKILFEEKDKIINKLDKFDKLEKYCIIRQGLIAYASKNENKKYNSSKKINDKYRKLLYGSDIKKYKISGSNDWLKYGSHLHRPRNSIIFDSKKILIQRLRNPKLKERLVATLDLDKHLNTNGLSNVVLKDQSNHDLLYLILGIINSNIINYWFSFYFKDLNVKPDQISQIPININDNDNSKKIVKLVKLILSENLRSDINEEKINNILNDIDKNVSKLFKIS